ncbi:MAG TPA: hypothetical protein VGN26_00970 [Armatimonadota bacterium]|jgi:hypothetical protein
MSSTTKWVVAGCTAAGVAAAVVVGLRARATASSETAMSRAERLVRQAHYRVTEMQTNLDKFRQVISAASPEAAG